jgi:hypothetical protein
VFTFYTSPASNGSTWTQLGNVVTQVGATNLFGGISPLELGGFANAGAQALVGKIYAASVRNGINGTAVFDWDLTRDGRSGTTTTASSGQTVTYTGSVTFGSTRF